MQSDDRIELLAEQFRAEMKIEDHLQPDMVDVAQAMVRQGKIEGVITFRDGAFGASEANYDPRTKIIYLSESCATVQRPQDRFTIAHEIGHVLLNHEYTRHRRSDHSQQFGNEVRKNETEANRLAAAILVPERLANVDMSTTVEDISRRFAVSAHMARLRLAELQQRYRARHKVSRPPLPRVRISATGQIEYVEAGNFDSGDYEEAFPQMMRNSTRWNSN